MLYSLGFEIWTLKLSGCGEGSEFSGLEGTWQLPAEPAAAPVVPQPRHTAVLLWEAVPA